MSHSIADKKRKSADARRRTELELVSSLGGALDTATVLREFSRRMGLACFAK